MAKKATEGAGAQDKPPEAPRGFSGGTVPRVSFRCKTCGLLETGGHAAEAEHPHACRCCGGGVRFDPRTGAKALDPDNWEVLADATPERLAELGLTKDQVERHEPWPRGATGRSPRTVDASAADGPAALDTAG